MIAEGRRTALLGLGSIEQHGPHLPLGTDRWIADSLLEGLAERLDDAIEAALMDILLLLVFNVLFFMLSYLFFLRYDVT